MAFQYALSRKLEILKFFNDLSNENWVIVFKVIEIKQRKIKQLRKYQLCIWQWCLYFAVVSFSLSLSLSVSTSLCLCMCLFFALFGRVKVNWQNLTKQKSNSNNERKSHGCLRRATMLHSVQANSWIKWMLCSHLLLPRLFFFFKWFTRTTSTVYTKSLFITFDIIYLSWALHRSFFAA